MTHNRITNHLPYRIKTFESTLGGDQANNMVTTLLRGGPDHEVDKGLAGNKFTLAVGSTKQGQTLQVQLHPFLSQDRKGGLIVKVQPPKEPADPNLHHVPCDIVLSIDVSASMSSAAPAPAAVPGEKEEFTGLTALDLVKHAAMTIVETLDERDRLGIITFSNDSKVGLTFKLQSSPKPRPDRNE